MNITSFGIQLYFFSAGFAMIELTQNPAIWEGTYHKNEKFHLPLVTKIWLTQQRKVYLVFLFKNLEFFNITTLVYSQNVP